MKKILGFALLFLIVPFLVGSVNLEVDFSEGVVNAANKESFNYLIVSFDEAASNTDAIIVVSYHPKANTVSFLQIPRDTYFNFSGKGGKINSIYTSLVSSGGDKNEAMNTLKTEISKSLGINIDGYAGYSIDAIKRVLSFFGPLSVNIPTDITYKDDDGNIHTVFTAGTHQMSAEEAINFMRFRKGYLMGDISRVEAQKIVISAFAKNVRDEFGIKLALRMLNDSKEGIITDISIKNLISLAFSKKGTIKDIKTLYATLPGSPVMDKGGVWYYSVNKSASVAVLKNIGYDVYAFDSEMRFLNSKDNNFKEIYEKQNHSWKIYDDSSVSKVNIK